MDLQSVPGWYRDQPFSTRLHIHGRWRLFSFPSLVKYVPEGDVYVDLGCGHGIWAFCLALQHPQARIVASDPDAEKIKVAVEIARQRGLSNIEFCTGKAQEMAQPACNLVSLIDILYLIPYEDQVEILKRCAAALLPGGRIMVKEIGSRPRWKYAINYLEELLAVRLLGITHGQKFYFRSEEEWQETLAGLGLKTRLVRLDKGYPHPHVLILGERV